MGVPGVRRPSCGSGLSGLGNVGSHSPNLYRGALPGFRPLPDPLIPPRAAIPVKENQVCLVRAAGGGVGSGLFQTLGDSGIQTLAPDLQFQHHSLQWSTKHEGFIQWPVQKQIHPLHSKTVFSGNPTTAVDDPLQKRLQQQLGTDLFILKPFDPGIGVFPEKLLKRPQQFGQVETADRTVHRYRPE